MVILPLIAIPLKIKLILTLQKLNRAYLYPFYDSGDLLNDTQYLMRLEAWEKGYIDDQSIQD